MLLHIEENMMRDIMALCKVYMINIMSNKFAFVYNLLLPIIYFIYKNGRLQELTEHCELLKNLSR